MLPRPIVAGLVIALGLPVLVLFAIVFLTSGVSSAIFSNIVTAAVIMSFVILMVFEIRRLADQSSDAH